MYLIQLLLPLHDNEKRPIPAEHFNRLRTDLTQRFGGVTAFVRAPAKGLWEEDEEINSDDDVVFEIIAENFAKDWWRDIEFSCNTSLNRKKSSFGPHVWRSCNNSTSDGHAWPRNKRRTTLAPCLQRYCSS